MNPLNPTVSIIEYEHVADAGRMLQHFCHGASKTAGNWEGAKIGTLNTETALLAQIGLLVITHDLNYLSNSIKQIKMADDLPHRTRSEVILASAVIRIADLAGALGLDLGPTIAELLAFKASSQKTGCNDGSN